MFSSPLMSAPAGNVRPAPMTTTARTVASRATASIAVLDPVDDLLAEGIDRRVVDADERNAVGVRTLTGFHRSSS